MSQTESSRCKIAVVMLTMNQRGKTLQCLSNLLSIKRPPFRVLLWDNGSKDGTVEAVRSQFQDVVAHHHPGNLGVAPGRNAAAALAIEKLKPTYLLFLDNDMLLESEFVAALLRPFLENPRVGQTQAKLRFLYDRERINDGGGCKITFWLGRTQPVGYREIDRGQYDESKPCVACGGAMMVRTDIFKGLGGFDTRFGHLGPDDLDFSLRLSKAGHLALYVPEAVAYHEVTHTYGADYGETYARLKAYNWFVFLRRHGSLGQQLAFLLVGAPYLALGILFREAKRGNLGAVRGLFRGAVDFCRSALSPSKR
jgi:GT2 family glycosyltransferase